MKKEFQDDMKAMLARRSPVVKKDALAKGRAFAFALAAAAVLSSCGAIAKANKAPDAARVREEVAFITGRKDDPAIMTLDGDRIVIPPQVLVGVGIAAALAIGARFFMTYAASRKAVARVETADDADIAAETAPEPSTPDEALAAAERGDYTTACLVLNRAAVALAVEDESTRASISNREVYHFLPVTIRSDFRTIFLNAERAEFGRVPADADTWRRSLDAWTEFKGGFA